MALKLEIVTLYGTICYPLSLGAPYMPGLPIRCAQHSPRCPLSWCPLTQPAQCNPTTCPLSPDQGVHYMGTSVAVVTMMPKTAFQGSAHEKKVTFFSSTAIYLLCSLPLHALSHFVFDLINLFIHTYYSVIEL